MKSIRLVLLTLIIICHQANSLQFLMQGDNKDTYNKVLELKNTIKESILTITSLIAGIKSNDDFELEMLSLIKDDITSITKSNESLGTKVQNILDKINDEIQPEELKIKTVSITTNYRILAAIPYDEISFIASFESQIVLTNFDNYTVDRLIAYKSSLYISSFSFYYHNDRKILLAFNTRSYYAYDWNTLQFIKQIDFPERSSNFYNITKNYIVFSSAVAESNFIFLFDLDKDKIIQSIYLKELSVS